MTRERPLLLVADDDADILELVTLRLERSGYDVLAASDGEHALELAREHRPDLAILDVSMPGLSGTHVTRRLRDEDATATLPVILLTARAQEEDLARGLAAGADDYVCKPFSAEDLSARVQLLLQHS
jgi:DNA-binding response OmpR family regulator